MPCARSPASGRTSSPKAQRHACCCNSREAGHGVAVVPSILQHDFGKLCACRVTYRGDPILLKLAVLWDRVRILPQHAQEFSELLAEHIRAQFPVRATRRKAGGRPLVTRLVVVGRVMTNSIRSETAAGTIRSDQIGSCPHALNIVNAAQWLGERPFTSCGSTPGDRDADHGRRRRALGRKAEEVARRALIAFGCRAYRPLEDEGDLVVHKIRPRAGRPSRGRPW